MAPNYSRLLTRNNVFLAGSAVTLLWILRSKRKGTKTSRNKRFVYI